MTIYKNKRATAADERPQRRRSGLKAVPAAVSARAGRRGAPTGGRAGGAASVTDAAAQASNVRVVVRVRPENERERTGGYRLVVRPLDDHMLIFDPRQQDEDFYFQGVRQRQRDLNKRPSKDMQYMFDRVFHPHHSNEQLFEATTKDVIDTVIEGFNCSVFAYGSTGAGKTHTMLGNSAEPGIIFLTVMELYNRIEAMADTRCQIAVSYVEVYNETVTDLLHPSGPLDVREDGQRAVVIAGLSQSTPDGPDHLMTILEAGNKNRTQHPTDMNAESSRSHAVFQVVLRQSDSAAGLSTDVRMSKLSLIDLAGSERGSATGHKGARFREGANINRSLLALGSCINALADGKKFVPYRDSKLTRLLKDSIGGNCKTVMIANVTPSAASFEDTHNTLKYANRAKAIKSRLQRNVVSVDMHVAQYAKVVDELRAEVADLRAQLAERPAAPSDQESRPASAAASEPPFDAAPLRSAEAARRALVTRQLQLEAEAQQLRLRLHRRRLCVQRAALLRPGGAARPDRQQDRLAGRLRQAHTRLEQARTELAAATQHAEEEAGRAPPGPATDQLTDQLSKERQLDECRVHAAHLEAFSRLLQLELNSSDHLLAQLITAFREQYRVLAYMKFVTPELEAQYKEVVGLVEGQKEVCWADQQQPAADSPGQPSYDVTALLRLADTTYQPAEPLRRGTSGLLLSAPAPPPVPLSVQPREAEVLPLVVGGVTTEHAGGDDTSAAGSGSGVTPARETPALQPPLPPPAMTPGLDTTPPSLSAVLPPSDVTLGCGADDDEVLIPGAATARADETPSRPRHHRPGSPVFFDAEPGPETPQATDRPAVAETAAVAAEAEQEYEEQTSPGAIQADRDLADETVTVPSPRELGAETSGGASPEESAGFTLSCDPVAVPSPDAKPAEFTRHSLDALSPMSTASTATVASHVSYDAEISVVRGAARNMKALHRGSPPPPARDEDGRGSPDGGSTEADKEGGEEPADLSAVDAEDAVSPAAAMGSVARQSVSPDLNTTVTVTVPRMRLSASPDLNTTVTVPAGQRRSPPSAAGDLNTTVTVPAGQRRCSPPNSTSAAPAARRRSPLTASAPAGDSSHRSPDLNTTVTVPESRRRSPPGAAPAVDLNATRTLSPAAVAPSSAGALPSFDSCSPIASLPSAASGAALCVALPPDLPPTPEILRRTRTPRKVRTAAPPPPPGSMDSTFTMEAQQPFRLPLAADGGGFSTSGGGGQRAVAGKTALRVTPSSGNSQPGAQRTGLSRSVSAAHVSQSARPGVRQPAAPPAPGSASRRGYEASARLASTAPNPARLSLSAQKARSTSRLHTSASGGRDENQPLFDRPAWGRTAPAPGSSASADKAASRHTLISAVGKLGLGRNRSKGGMVKSRSEAVLKPANH